MSEIKNSTILEKLLQNAKTFGEKINPTLTAERFILAVIDATVNADGEDKEIIRAKKVFEAHKIDLLKAKEKMTEYIDGNNESSFVDGLYLQRKMYEAKNLSAKKGDAELTVDNLLACVFEDPSESIKSILIGSVDENNSSNMVESSKVSSGTGKKIEEMLDALDVLDLDEIDRKIEETLSNIDDESDNNENEKRKEPVDTKSAMDSLVSNIKSIRKELQGSILGQDNAINMFVTGYFQANLLSMIDKSRKRPKATFLFAGPPGVGKTFLAEKVSEALKLPYARFDMSEYSDREANLEFCGSDKVYKNAKEGNVTGFVAENPECVILFDEIEKAHINVIHLFLQMLDAGRLRDNFSDKEVSFTNAIIILTTNAGRQLYEENESGDFSSVSRKVIIRALQKDINPETGASLFPSAICSRFASGNVVMFNHIAAHNLRGIAKKEIERHALNLENETGIKMQIDDKVYTALLFAEGSAADARTVRGRAETFFNDELYELLRLVASEKVKTNISELEKITVTVDLSRSSEIIKPLFEISKDAKVLIFADKDIIELCKIKTNSFDVLGAQTVDEAVKIMKNNEISFILLDMCCGVSNNSISNLNIEDADSEARKYFKFLREQGKAVPVYLLENRTYRLSDEEKTSFVRQGVRGFLKIKKGKDSFSEQMETIVTVLHQQANMIKLARQNKLVSFETAQTISKNGKNAEIKLFDFEMTVAVDSEDAKNILSSVSKPNVKFDDIIGAGEAKKELKYFVEYLKNPKRYIGTGVKAPKGVLLYGSPGTGKTMLAKAMASEAGVTFIAAEGNQFLKKFVGEGSEKVHELFKTARKYAPSILFVDEIDAIAKERKGFAATSGGTEETLTAFLTEMDGFVNDPSKPVFVLAATNFDVESGSDKSLDPALMRRFDRRVYIELPNKSDRIRFIKMKIDKNSALKISSEQVENIALRATGMSLAEMDSIVELSLRLAIREGSTIVTDEIFEEAFETFNSGEVRKWDISQLERVARHEAGHALICYLGGETPSYLTIVARGNHGGYMQHAEQEGKAIYTKDELLAKIRTSLGGRAAEIVYYGEQAGISTGASGDLISATDIAQKIVCTYGMDEDFGLAVVPGQVLSNSNMSIEVRNTVNKILKEQMDDAIRLISENKDKIDALVERLMDKNHMNGAEIEQTIEMEKEASRITKSE